MSPVFLFPTFILSPDCHTLLRVKEEPLQHRLVINMAKGPSVDSDSEWGGRVINAPEPVPLNSRGQELKR